VRTRSAVAGGPGGDVTPVEACARCTGGPCCNVRSPALSSSSSASVVPRGPTSRTSPIIQRPPPWLRDARWHVQTTIPAPQTLQPEPPHSTGTHRSRCRSVFATGPTPRWPACWSSARRWCSAPSLRRPLQRQRQRLHGPCAGSSRPWPLPNCRYERIGGIAADGGTHEVRDGDRECAQEAHVSSSRPDGSAS